jgi:hypothetical protein
MNPFKVDRSYSVGVIYVFCFHTTGRSWYQTLTITEGAPEGFWSDETVLSMVDGCPIHGKDRLVVEKPQWSLPRTYRDWRWHPWRRVRNSGWAATRWSAS